MKNRVFVSCTVTLLVVPLLAFSAVEEDVQIIEVSESEVVVVADEDNPISDVVELDDVSIAAGIGDCDPIANSTGFASNLAFVGANDFTCSQMPTGHWSQLVTAQTSVSKYPFMGGLPVPQSVRDGQGLAAEDHGLGHELHLGPLLRSRHDLALPGDVPGPRVRLRREPVGHDDRRLRAVELIAKRLRIQLRRPVNQRTARLPEELDRGALP